jgi:hypothetical protein
VKTPTIAEVMNVKHSPAIPANAIPPRGTSSRAETAFHHFVTRGAIANKYVRME